MILGNNLILCLDGKPLAASKSCKFNISQNFIEACSPTDARVLKKIPTTYDWNMTGDALCTSMAAASTLVDAVKNGQEFTAIVYDYDIKFAKYGKAYIASCDITGTVGSLVAVSISIEGSGELVSNYTVTNEYTDWLDSEKSIYISNGEIYCVAQSDGSKGFQFVLYKPTKVTVTCGSGTNDWAIIQSSFSDIKNLIHNEDAQGLNTYKYAAGLTSSTINSVPAGTYTFIKDAHASCTVKIG